MSRVVSYKKRDVRLLEAFGTVNALENTRWRYDITMTRVAHNMGLVPSAHVKGLLNELVNMMWLHKMRVPDNRGYGYRDVFRVADDIVPDNPGVNDIKQMRDGGKRLL